MLPWEEPVFVTYKCKYCGQEQPQVGGSVLVCSCAEAQQEEALERQRVKNWQKQREEARRARK